MKLMRVIASGSIFASTPKSGREKPCLRSAEVNSKTSGSPFLTVISAGENSNFFAVTRMTFSLGEPVLIEAAKVTAPDAAVSVNSKAIVRFIILSFRDGEIRNFILGLSDLGFDIAEAQPFIWRCRVPEHRGAFRRGPGRRQWEDQRFRRVVCDVAGRVVMFLMDMPIEYGNVLVRHQGVNDGCGVA